MNMKPILGRRWLLLALLSMFLFSCGSPYGKWEGKWMKADDNWQTIEIRVIDDMPVLTTKRGLTFPILTEKKPMKVVVSGQKTTLDFIYDPEYDVIYLNGEKFIRKGK
jgi:hypothetical protein